MLVDLSAPVSKCWHAKRGICVVKEEAALKMFGIIQYKSSIVRGWSNLCYRIYDEEEQ